MKNKRNLNEKIVDFIIAWDQVLDAKEELSEASESQKAEIQKRHQDRAKKDPFFAYVYDWLELDETGEISPHQAKRSDSRSNKPKMRHTKYPLATDIVDYFCDYYLDQPEQQYQTIESVDRSVRRALPRLVADGKLERTSDKTYRPLSIDYKRKLMIEEAKFLSLVNERKAFKMSSNTIIVFFDNSADENEIQFFTQFVGAKALVDIFVIEKKLFILFKGSSEEKGKISRAIKKAVDRAYQDQHDIGEHTKQRIARISNMKEKI